MTEQRKKAREHCLLHEEDRDKNIKTQVKSEKRARGGSRTTRRKRAGGRRVVDNEWRGGEKKKRQNTGASRYTHNKNIRKREYIREQIT